MAFTFKNKVAAGSANSDDITTAAVDMTGADLLVAEVADYQAATRNAVPTDSLGNTWTPLTAYVCVGDTRSRLWYVKNATVGGTQTFTSSGSVCYPSINVAGFSGSDLSAPFDAENGSTATSSTSVATGTVTPGANSELVITGFAYHGAESTNLVTAAGFTITNVVDFVTGQHYGGGLAYAIQTTASSTSATWTKPSVGALATGIASFKIASGAASPGGILSQGLTSMGVQ